MAMNEWLANHYNTNGAAEAQHSEEETQKFAHAELFAKVAAKHNIDLTKLSADEKADLYLKVFPEEAQKLAQDNGEEKEEGNGKKPPPFPPKKEEGNGDKEEDKEAAAQAHWQEKRAAQEKFAEADLMGRVMAHAFTDELGKIKQAAAEKQAAEQPGEKVAAEKCPKCGKENCDCPAAKDGDKEAAAQAAPSTAGVVKNANAQAFEELAARRAIEMAKQAEYDEQEAFDRINSVYILGLEESEKVASVQDFNQGVHIRALEYLEAAKYPVDWEAVFGKAS